MDPKVAAEQLKEAFPQGIVEIIEFMDEVTVEIHRDTIREALRFLKQAAGPGFEVLMDYSGVDYLFPEKRTKVYYWLHNPTDLTRIRLIVYVPRGQPIPSIADIWAGASWYERELFDLLGVFFQGHPDMKRILLPDDWVGHPLRRDYKLTEEPVEFKFGVKPKVPSEIIPHGR